MQNSLTSEGATRIMCGRFTLRTPAKTLSTLFDDLQFPKLEPRYNIAPTQNVLCVRQSTGGAIEPAMLRWGLVPSWAKDLKIGARMINARSETADTKPSFRAAFKSRRCLVLADGFFEWKKLADRKQPFYVTQHDDQPMCFAGLWESWTDKTSLSSGAPTVESCTILTTAANQMISAIHDRMPVIVNQAHQALWLDQSISDRASLENLFAPCADQQLKMISVSSLVNKPSNDQPACIEPMETHDDD